MESDEEMGYDYDADDNLDFATPPSTSNSARPRPVHAGAGDYGLNDSVDEDDGEFDDHIGSDEDVSLDDDLGLSGDGRFRRESQVLSSSLREAGVSGAGALNSPSAGGKEPLHAISTSGQDVPYDVLSPEQICQYMTEVVREVNQVLQLPTTTVRLLLSQLNWDKESLMERFFEDSEKLFQDAHVVCRSDSIGSDKEDMHAASTSKETCEICYTTLKSGSGDWKGTDCGHRFCGSCWKTYLTGKIVDENITYKIECPAHDCHILVDDVFVMQVISNSHNVRRKYQHGITNSFVESHRCMRWCPGADCLYAVRVRSAEWMPVKCTQCQTTFCFLCGQPWHDPVTCDVLKRWRKKCADDSETSNWIAANTKECPTCHATIEKDGGCNHVVCKNAVCKAEFCWICLGPWQPHGSSWFKCNRYTDDEAKAARDAQEKSRFALQRYLFYFNRYMNHQQSLKLETKLNNSILLKMEELQQHNMSWIEVQFLQKAVNILQQCRQTLMYTYVFAFYLQKNNQQIMFEDNQHDLENATETLSGYLERDITGQNAVEIKQKVQDKASYCEIRRRALVDHVHEGYDKDWWEFSS
ncbi:E3 ubiquitin-protein ligase arih1-like [Paramacrobiotus metropolitanus]|uniref:E3 ubiquitin-protein ligase arih1-like n=1 Tax=Paramacrobiotus metropolitanus TaxID=2943436 RepID=UPI002445893D|nr:E3 ubiquitin-protein ligase arih1-like [Paramacrobiotus metropolitanus]